MYAFEISDYLNRKLDPNISSTFREKMASVINWCSENSIFLYSRKCKLSLDSAQTQDGFIFPDPAVRVNPSSDSDATPIGGGTPATSSPTSSLSLGARGPKQDMFVEPKPVQVRK